MIRVAIILFLNFLVITAHIFALAPTQSIWNQNNLYQSPQSKEIYAKIQQSIHEYKDIKQAFTDIYHLIPKSWNVGIDDLIVIQDYVDGEYAIGIRLKRRLLVLSSSPIDSEFAFEQWTDQLQDQSFVVSVFPEIYVLDVTVRDGLQSANLKALGFDQMIIKTKLAKILTNKKLIKQLLSEGHDESSDQMIALTQEIDQLNEDLDQMMERGQSGLKNFIISLLHKIYQVSGLKDIESASVVNPKFLPNMSQGPAVIQEINAQIGRTTSLLIMSAKQLRDQYMVDDPELTKFHEGAVVLSSTDGYQKKNTGKSIEQSKPGIQEIVKILKDKGKPTRGYISSVFGDPSQADMRIEEVFKSVIDIIIFYAEIGVTEIDFGDTTGRAHPVMVEQLLNQIERSGLLEKYPQLEFSFHFHDSVKWRGMAAVNIFAVIAHGNPRFAIFDGSIGGLGGSPFAAGVTAGNIPTESLALVFQVLGIDSRMQIQPLIDIVTYLREQLTFDQSAPYPLPTPFLYDDLDLSIGPNIRKPFYQQITEIHDKLYLREENIPKHIKLKVIAKDADEVSKSLPYIVLDFDKKSGQIIVPDHFPSNGIAYIKFKNQDEYPQLIKNAFEYLKNEYPSVDFYYKPSHRYGLGFVNLYSALSANVSHFVIEETDFDLGSPFKNILSKEEFVLFLEGFGYVISNESSDEIFYHLENSFYDLVEANDQGLLLGA